MKKIRFIIAAAVMAGLFFTSGCVDNEESDSVRQMRQAQTALIQARADAITMTAEAEAAWNMARAAYEQARARMQEIWNDYEEAMNEIEIQEALAQLEATLVNAERSLAQAELQLHQALLALEKAVADSETEMAKYYLQKYTTAMNAVLSKRLAVINKMDEIERAQLNINAQAGPFKLVELHLKEKERLEKELELILEYQELYVAAVTDPDEIAELLLAAEGVDVELRAERMEKERERKKLYKEVFGTTEDGTEDGLQYDYNQARTYYTTTLPTEIADLEGWIDEWTNSPSTSRIGRIDRLNEGLDINDWYWSRKFYEDGLDAIDDLFEAAEEREEEDGEPGEAAAQAALNDAADAYNAHFFNHFDERGISADWHVLSPNAPFPFTGPADFEAILAMDWDALKEVVVDEWTIVGDYIEEILEPELESLQDEVEPALAAVKETYDALQEALDAHSELVDEIAMLNIHINYNQAYINDLLSDRNDIVSGLENLENVIIAIEGELAELDIKYATWESYLAYLEAQLEQLLAEHDALLEEAEYWKTMLDGELGDE